MNRKLLNTTLALALGASVIAGGAFAQENGSSESAPEAPAAETAEFNANLMASLKAQPELTRFAELLERAGLNHRLNDGGSYTLLALSNAAMTELNELHDMATFGDFELQSVTHAFILDGAITPEELAGLDEIDSLTGYTYKVETTDGVTTVDGVRIDTAEVIVTDNGVIYTLEEPLEQVNDYVQGLPAVPTPVDEEDNGTEDPEAD